MSLITSAARVTASKKLKNRGLAGSEIGRLTDAIGRVIPTSAPDAEEIMRRQRRKFLAQQRRRSGRMSTILTGGDSSGMGLG